MKHRNSTASLSGLKRDITGSNSTISQKSALPPVRQQLPMKLAKLASAGPIGGGVQNFSSGAVFSPPTQGSVPVSSYSSPPTQQMLPLKLSENISSGGVKSSSSYQRLPSPLLLDPDGSATVVGGQQYGSSHRKSLPSALPHHQQGVPSERQPSQNAARISSSVEPSEGTSPGQRIKDPDSNQDIIFL